MLFQNGKGLSIPVPLYDGFRNAFLDFQVSVAQIILAEDYVEITHTQKEKKEKNGKKER